MKTKTVKPVVVTLTGELAATVRREATEVGISSQAMARHAISTEMAATLNQSNRQTRVSWAQFTELENALREAGFDPEHLTDGPPINFKYYASAYRIEALAFGSDVHLSIVRIPTTWRRRRGDDGLSALVTLIESIR